MGISKYLLAAALSFCALGNLSAADSVKHSKKHYLDARNICVSEDGIIVRTKSGKLMIKTLRSDENGLYVFKEDLSAIAKGVHRSPRIITCRCGNRFSGEEAYWRHVDSGDCPYYPRR